MLKRNKANYFLFLFIDNNYLASNHTQLNVYKLGSTTTKNDFLNTFINEEVRRLTSLGLNVRKEDNNVIIKKSEKESVYFFILITTIQILRRIALKLLREGAKYVK